MSLFDVIFRNIIGFDGIIFILAVINCFIFIYARKAAVKLYESMHKKIYAPFYSDDIQNTITDMQELTKSNISALIEKAGAAYTLYINISSIFPLMGILGTVISLIGMSGNTANMDSSFFAALTSTFWGLIFAIIFKFADGFISAKLYDGERSAELFMSRKYNSDISEFSEDEKIPVFSGETEE